MTKKRTSVNKDMEKLEYSYTTGQNVTGYSHCKNYFAVSQKVKYRFAI